MVKIPQLKRGKKKEVPEEHRRELVVRKKEIPEEDPEEEEPVSATESEMESETEEGRRPVVFRVNTTANPATMAHVVGTVGAMKDAVERKGYDVKSVRVAVAPQSEAHVHEVPLLMETLRRRTARAMVDRVKAKLAAEGDGEMPVWLEGDAGTPVVEKGSVVLDLVAASVPRKSPEWIHRGLVLVGSSRTAVVQGDAELKAAGRPAKFGVSVPEAAGLMTSAEAREELLKGRIPDDPVAAGRVTETYPGMRVEQVAWSPVLKKVGDILDMEGWKMHQANGTTDYGAGLAGALFGRWPEANDYESSLGGHPPSSSARSGR